MQDRSQMEFDLADELRDVIDRQVAENDLTPIEVIGILEALKREIMDDFFSGEDDDEDDEIGGKSEHLT